MNDSSEKAAEALRNGSCRKMKIEVKIIGGDAAHSVGLGGRVYMLVCM